MTTETKAQIKERVLTEPDYINSKKYRYSLSKYLKNNPTSPDNIIAHLLCMDEEEVQKVFESAVIKIRQYMRVEV